MAKTPTASSRKKTPAKKTKATPKTKTTPKSSFSSSRLGIGSGGGASHLKTPRTSSSNKPNKPKTTTPRITKKAAAGQEPTGNHSSIIYEDAVHQFYSSVECIPQREKFMKSDPLSGPTFGQNNNANDNANADDNGNGNGNDNDNIWVVKMGDFACIENPSSSSSSSTSTPRGKVKAVAPFTVPFRACQILSFFKERIMLPPKSKLTTTKKKGWGPLKAEVRWLYRNNNGGDLDERNARYEKMKIKKKKQQQNGLGGSTNKKKKEQQQKAGIINSSGIADIEEVFESGHVTVVNANLLLGRLVLKNHNQQLCGDILKYPVPTVVNYCRRYYLHEEKDILELFDDLDDNKMSLLTRGLECSELLLENEKLRTAAYTYLGIASSSCDSNGDGDMSGNNEPLLVVSLPPPTNRNKYGVAHYTHCTLSHPLSEITHANLLCPPSKRESFPKWQLCVGDVVAVNCDDGAKPACGVDVVEGRDEWYPYRVPWSHCQITAIYRDDFDKDDDDGVKKGGNNSADDVLHVPNESVSCEIRWFPRVSEALAECSGKKTVSDKFDETVKDAERTCEEILEGKQLSIINCGSLLGPVFIDDDRFKKNNLPMDNVYLGCRFLPRNRRTVSSVLGVGKEGKPTVSSDAPTFHLSSRLLRGLDASNQALLKNKQKKKTIYEAMVECRKQRKEAECVAREEEEKKHQVVAEEGDNVVKEESVMPVAGTIAAADVATVADIAAETSACTERSPHKKRQLFHNKCDDFYDDNAGSKRPRVKREEVSLEEAPQDTTMAESAASTNPVPNNVPSIENQPPTISQESHEPDRVSCTTTPFHVDVSALKSFYEELDVIPPFDSYDDQFSIGRRIGKQEGKGQPLWKVKLGDTVTIHQDNLKDVNAVFHFPFVVAWAPAEVVSIYRKHETKESCARLREEIFNNNQKKNGASSASEGDGEIVLEVRWLYRLHEIPGATQKKSNLTVNDDKLEEVFETDEINVCSAHSILSPVQLYDVTKVADAPKTKSGMPCIHYHCSRLWSIHRKSFLPSGSLTNRVERGRMHSAHTAAFNKLQQMISLRDSTTASLSRSKKTQAKKPWKESFESAIQQLSLAEAAADAQENGVVLACREKERKQITSFLKKAICGLTTQSSNNEDGGPGEVEETKNLKSSIFIAGPPGTGKTASVRSVIAELQKEQHAGLLPEFNFISLNGMELRHPFDSYVKFWEALSGTRKEKLPAGDAANRLEHYFCGDRFQNSTDDEVDDDEESNDYSDLSKKPVIVLMLDEIDYIVTQKETIIYNFFDWPLRATTARLVVVGISNTINLPEKLQPRLTSRIGGNRCHFRSYNVQDTITILKTRLGMLDGDNSLYPVFEDDAIKFAARKTANLSGDIRKAFHMCKVAAETVFEEYTSGKKKLTKGSRPIVRISDVQKGSRDLLTSIVHTAVKCSTTYEALLLISLGALKRTRAEDGSSFLVREVLTKIESIANASGEQRYMNARLSFADMLGLVNRLGDAGIIQLLNSSNSSPWPWISTHLHTFEILGAYRDTPHCKLAEKHLAEARLF